MQGDRNPECPEIETTMELGDRNPESLEPSMEPGDRNPRPTETPPPSDELRQTVEPRVCMNNKVGTHSKDARNYIKTSGENTTDINTGVHKE